MQEKPQVSRLSRFLMTVASFVIVVAGIQAAASILVPFFLAVFIATICMPLLNFTRRKHIPNALGIMFIIAIILASGVFVSSFLLTTLNELSIKLPVYQTQITAKIRELLVWLNAQGIEISSTVVNDYFNPGTAFKLAGNMINGLRIALTNGFLVFLTVVFILVEASGFPQKVRAAIDDPEESLGHLNQIAENVNRYLAIKTVFSLMTGVILGVMVGLVGIDFPLLWGLLAFLLNYVPNIGSIIAAIPPVILALIQFGYPTAILVGLGFIIVNVTISTGLEPRFMGRGLGLSTLIVFLSLVFWGWVLGPIGMLLSVPLTMIIKVALESNDDTRWIAVLLGSAQTVSKHEKH
ncbi:MAG: hypothetical protein CSA22_04275 [Deltaproteobacteria bacterium]|nr:MAG: hypothetical protein CSA22_04275 [Deltaproteobacteria bacterium]